MKLLESIFESETVRQPNNYGLSYQQHITTMQWYTQIFGKLMSWQFPVNYTELWKKERGKAIIRSNLTSLLDNEYRV